MGRIYSIIVGGNINKYKRGSPYAPLLLQSGFAKLDRYAEDGDMEGDSVTQLQASQDLAKLGKLGIWSIPQPEIEDQELDLEGSNIDANEGDGATGNGMWTVGNSVNVKLTEIVDVASCYLNIRQNDGEGQLGVIAEAIADLVPILCAFPERVPISRGQLVAVKFEEKIKKDSDAESADQHSVASYWCRGVVDSVGKSDAVVFYVDYGDR
jgi:hypothetical protein